MKTFFLNRNCYLIATLLFLFVIALLATKSILSGLILSFAFVGTGLSLLGFLRLGIYRQILIFLVLLQMFTFVIKVGYGIINSTALAILPAAYLGAMLISVCLLGAQGKISVRFSLLDMLVFSFFVLDFIQIFNPYLNALSNQDALIIGLRGFQQRSFFGLVYFVIRWLKISSSRFNTILRVLAYTAALGSTYALIQQLFGFDSWEAAYRLAEITKNPLLEAQYIARAEGFLSSPFTFGLISATGLISGIYLFNCVQIPKLERRLSVVSVLLNSVGVVLSGSRSTYFSLIVMCFILVLSMRMRLSSLMFRSTRTIIAILIAIGFLFAFFPNLTPVQYSMERIGSLSEIFASNNSINDMNFIIRRELISASVPMILSHPFGYGTGIFNGGSNPHGLVKVNGYSTFMDNEFVGLALELGILGAIIFFSIVAVALQRCRCALRVTPYQGRARILAALMIICPIAGVGGQWLAAYPINIIFWVILGLIASLPVYITSR